MHQGLQSRRSAISADEVSANGSFVDMFGTEALAIGEEFKLLNYAFITSTAWFLHCWWNSTLESIVNGVPMIAWPLYVDQKMNDSMLTEQLRVAVQSEVSPTKEVVARNEIATMVEKIMEGKGGNVIRAEVNTLKLSA
ncbi:UDPGT domain-containing protein [Cephalotus follicularis]|uniref:UDPGT domain-containing protein n=1 Tax=Cephalotus follicularis TaxID=3775 RepID=A0A1Q3B1V6_CEPFO|nr:UDPGT domain-containing protein [Cephalotus follicularis]